MGNQKKVFKKTFTMNGKAEERMVVVDSIKEWNECGHMTYRLKSNGSEEWREFNEKNRLVHDKLSNGWEKWREYDENDRLIHEWYSDGREEWQEYNENGNIIHVKRDDWEEWREHDENGNCVHKKDSYGTEEWNEYDENGNITYQKKSDGGEEFEEERKERDERGNVIHVKFSRISEIEKDGKLVREELPGGYEAWYEYDERGNKIHAKSLDGIEEWYEYDEHGNQTHEKHSNGYEAWFEYDERGNATHKKDSSGWEEWHEYDKHGNEIHEKHYDGKEAWFEYDERGNIAHFKSSDPESEGMTIEEWYAYDEKNNKICERCWNAGGEYWGEREYHENGKLKKLVYYKVVDARQKENMESQQDITFEKTFTVNGETEGKLASLYEFIEYDERGKEIIHRYYRNGKLPRVRTFRFHVDAEGKKIWHRYFEDCFEVRREYDANGNEIHSKDSRGYECWREYDEHGKLVRGKTALNNAVRTNEWYDCDEHGNIVHRKKVDYLSNVLEEWSEYDENGNRINERRSEIVNEEPDSSPFFDETIRTPYQRNHSRHYEYEYDAERRLILEEREEGSVKWRHEYDEKGNRVRSWNSIREKRFKYDERGRLTYHTEERNCFNHHFSLEEWREYDEAGREVRRKYRTESYEELRWYEYGYHENGGLKTLAIYRHHENLEKASGSGSQSVAES